MWPQWSVTKTVSVKERYRFILRLDGNNIPVRFMSQTPNTTVNLSSPESFGKFASQAGSSYSTMGGTNGQIIISGRFEF